MKSKFVLVAALAAGALTPAGLAQTTAPAASASAQNAAPAPPPPQAIPAKIAFIELIEVAQASNEGQNTVIAIQKKYESTKTSLDTLGAEIESLTKQLQAAPATMSDEERASRQRAIETKQKQFQRDRDDASSAYSTEVQDALAKIEGKLGPVVVKYVQQNGYTVLLDNAGQPQQGGISLLWGGTDISQAVIDAYNTSSGAPAPVPSAPSAGRTRPNPASRPAPAKPAPKQ